jgi:hypothetical protein
MRCGTPKIYFSRIFETFKEGRVSKLIQKKKKIVPKNMSSYMGRVVSFPCICCHICRVLARVSHQWDILTIPTTPEPEEKAHSEGTPTHTHTHTPASQTPLLVL